MSVSETVLTDLPAPGMYVKGAERYEIRNSKRNHWYAMRHEPDGSLTYLAQNINLDSLESERQRNCWGCEHLGVDGCGVHSDHMRKLRTMTVAEISSTPGIRPRKPTLPLARNSQPQKRPVPITAPCLRCQSPAIFDSGLCGAHERQRCENSWTHTLARQGYRSKS